jgi:hypothetical protein
LWRGELYELGAGGRMRPVVEKQPVFRSSGIRVAQQVTRRDT